MLNTALNGYNIVDYDTVVKLREKDGEKPDPYTMMPQEGGQETLLTSLADICIYGGQRGGGKSHALLMEPMNDIYNPFFRGCILRKEIGDLDTMIDTSGTLYAPFGTYKMAKNDMTWKFNDGGQLRFDYFADSLSDFKDRFQGQELPFVGIDEITQMEYAKFRFLMSSCRNSHFMRNRMIGTCNPDPDSWVARFIDWWIGDDGTPIPERDGVVRYCFMDGESVEDIIWGDTREEVYAQCKSTIDRYWKEEYSMYGSPEALFIKSVTFIEGKLSDNKKLLRSDPTYLANLMNRPEEDRARDLEGNWHYRALGDDIIKLTHMENFFNSAEMTGDGVLRASCDVAFTGGDNLVMWLLKGMHVLDVYVLRGADSRKAMEMIKAQLEAWRVREENFTFDVSGLGQGLRGFFPKAVPFNNREAAFGVPRGTFDCIKSQCGFFLADKLIRGEMSINPELLDRRFSGDGFAGMRLRDILMRERRAIRAVSDNDASGKCLIKKASMKKIVGHSPDFIEALLMAMIFFVKHKRTIKGLGWL
jgi:hypothetical protein